MVMTKRRDILAKLKKAAKAAGLSYETIEGGNHTVVLLDGMRLPVARHNEIDNIMAEVIYKQAEAKLGKGWWKK